MKTMIQGEKNPFLAVFLSACISPIWGYLYIGQWQKFLATWGGFTFFGFIVLWNMMFIRGNSSCVVVSIIMILMAISIILICVDVFMQARILENGGIIGHWTFFMQELKKPEDPNKPYLW